MRFRYRVSGAGGFTWGYDWILCELGRGMQVGCRCLQQEIWSSLGGGSLCGSTSLSGSQSVGRGKETMSIATVSKLNQLAMLVVPFNTLLKAQRG